MVWCSAVRVGRGSGTPLAERECYTGTVLHTSVQIVQNGVAATAGSKMLFENLMKSETRSVQRHSKVSE